jgi:tetratricopeptide (TPR) repeat protein
MDFAEQLHVIQAAQGDPAKLALATVEIAYPSMPEIDRLALKTALEAAAIPHWCDESVMSALLAIPEQESSTLLASLRCLSVVEPFPARGGSAVNVHEATRMAFRERLARDDRNRFRQLSSRAAACFEGDNTQAGRVEWVYHLLCGHPERGADKLQELGRVWYRTARPEDRYALTAALSELENTGVLEGRARVWALLLIAWIRAIRGEAAQLGNIAETIVTQAKSTGDRRAEADAQALLGESLQAQGRLREAVVAFEKAVEINQRLSVQEPQSADMQLELATTYGQLGEALEAQGEFSNAQLAFEKALSISQRLVEQDPTNAACQRDLAMALQLTGGVLEEQSKFSDAQFAFESALTINNSLVDQDPNNNGCLRDLAVAYNRIGGVLQQQNRWTDAQVAFESALTINKSLVEQDPSNSGWQRDLAIAYNRMGGVLQARGKLSDAQLAFESAVTINKNLTELDSKDAEWQHYLAIAYNGLGRVLEAQNKLTEADLAFEAAMVITQRLADLDVNSIPEAD